MCSGSLRSRRSPRREIHTEQRISTYLNKYRNKRKEKRGALSSTQRIVVIVLSYLQLLEEACKTDKDADDEAEYDKEYDKVKPFDK